MVWLKVVEGVAEHDVKGGWVREVMGPGALNLAVAAAGQKVVA